MTSATKAIEVGCTVEINPSAESGFLTTKWWPKGIVTGNVQKLFKNGRVAVAVHQLKNLRDSGDGLRTYHFNKSDLTICD